MLVLIISATLQDLMLVLQPKVFTDLNTEGMMLLVLRFTVSLQVKRGPEVFRIGNDNKS